MTWQKMERRKGQEKEMAIQQEGREKDVGSGRGGKLTSLLSSCQERDQYLQKEAEVDKH